MVEPGWPLDELARRTTAALRRVALAPASGRVRDLPDPRTIRYYTTLGLLDRPQGYRGRVALYGARHLLQLVAIKRLQAEGRALSEVQRRLYGLTDAELASLAALPPGVVELPSGPPGEAASAAPSRPAARPFWKAGPPTQAPTTPAPRGPLAPPAGPRDPADGAGSASPGAPASGRLDASASPGAPASARFEASAPPGARAPGRLDAGEPPPGAPLALRLAPSALLILERPGGALTDDDERALREAAAPLVRWLAARIPPLEPPDES
ncbi:MAG TPA: MerR family transcriptional regulator [Polyangiaceae bacterium]|nr:MerR family transcriptional regulator [Polyangiaceae bacterium]